MTSNKNSLTIIYFFATLLVMSCGNPGDGDDSEIEVVNPSAPAGTISMNFSDALGQIFMIRASNDCNYLGEVKPGGVVFWGADISDEDHARQDNINMQTCMKNAHALPLITSTNHEGGRVHYFKGSSQMVHFPAAAIQCQRGAAYVNEVSSAQASELRYAGMNANLGPDADILITPSNVIGDRAYSSSAANATTCIEQAYRGYESHQMKAVLKHFPGHGGTSSDTHSGFALDSTSRPTIEASHLRPYKQIIGINSRFMVMTSHVYYPSLDNSWPATLSKTILTDLLRTQMGFSGLVMTDSMTMGAIVSKWAIEDAAIISFMAGADMLMIKEPSVVRQIKQRIILGTRQGISISALGLNGTSQQFTFTPNQIKSQVQIAVNRIMRVKKDANLLNFNFLNDLRNAREPNWSIHSQLGTATHAIGTDPTAQD